MTFIQWQLSLYKLKLSIYDKNYKLPEKLFIIHTNVTHHFMWPADATAIEDRSPSYKTNKNLTVLSSVSMHASCI